MIRTLLTTTALVALVSTGAFAQEATTTTDPNTAATEGTASMPTAFEMGQGYSYVDTDNLVSRLMGTPVYSGTAEDAENIGEVNDVVFATSGQIQAVIIGVGGFLGIGEKNVAVPFGQLQWTVAADNTERWVVATTREELDAAPAFEVIEDEPADNNAAADGAMAPADNAMAPADNTAMAPAEDNAMAPADQTAAASDNAAVAPAETAPATETAPAEDTAMAPADDAAAAPADNAMAPAGDTATAMTPVDRTTLSDLDESALTADELIGTRVVGPDNNQIAEVGDLVLTEDGQIDAVLVDFGGFLGIGEKRVAIGMDDLDFATDENGNRYVFLSNITREQLEAAPAYDETTYASDPTQRMTVGGM